MDKERIGELVKAQRDFFDGGHTRSFEFRVAQLRKLKEGIKKNEDALLQALHADMHKPRLEAFMSEIGIVYEELDHAITHLRAWMQPELVETPLALQISTSKIIPSPLGLVLVIGPWNYPFQLLIAPLIGAMAAGNCCILKPSDNTPATASLLEKMIGETFPENYISVVQGPGGEVGPILLENFRFDHVFFTGSATTGKQIMKMAADHLSPVTLELGGKSPGIVDRSANLSIAAKRLIWAKCFNAGQTCVAPDYLLVHESVKKELITKMISCLKDFFGKEPLKSKDLAHIINKKRFDTLLSYLENTTILHGGKSDASTLCIEPTLVENIPGDHPLMKEEIFGPILPVISFSDLHEAIAIIKKHRYPLSCYIFTNDKRSEDLMVENVEFGGGCINNALAHLANPRLPFGGVGYSGMGKYHGKYSFDTFSHSKSILRTRNFFDPFIKYPPYSDLKEKLIRYLF